MADDDCFGPGGFGRTRDAAGHAGGVAVVTGGGRRRAGVVAGRLDTGRPGRSGVGSTDERFAQDLPAFRAAVWTMPESAVRLLHNELHAYGPVETAAGVDVMILLAEVVLRCRDSAAAVQAAGRAVRAAENLYPVDDRRRLCAYGVAADITLYAHQPARTLYNQYLHQLTATGDWAEDRLRVVYARAGHAVATWREASRARGRQLLTDLCQWSRDQQGRHHAVTLTLAEALTAMHVVCGACGSRTPGRSAGAETAPLAPLPGGILQPDLSEPDRSYLATRLHDCSTRPP